MKRKNILSYGHRYKRYLTLIILGMLSTTVLAETSFSRHGPDNRYVRLDSGDLKIDFDTWYGGAPLAWYLYDNTTSIIQVHPGSGFQVTYETGQDSTQAGSNGSTLFKVAKQGDYSAKAAYDNYYCRENLPSNWPNGSNSYRITCSPPDFWASLDAIDDSLAPLSDGQAQKGWKTLYNPKNHNANEFTGVGVPIWFEPENAQSGIIMVGNEMKGLSQYGWNQRLREIDKGRSAFRSRISLMNASAGAWGGLMFRRDVPSHAGATMDDAYNSSGYFLNVNKSGNVELIRSNGASQTSVWQGNGVAHNVNTTDGTLLEIRTHNGIAGHIEIWVNEAHVGTYVDSHPLLGKHTGLIAATQSGGVRFADRALFDMSSVMEFVATAAKDGSVKFDVNVKNAPFVSEPRNLYRLNLVGFLDAPVDPSLGWIGTFDNAGNPLHALSNSGQYSEINPYNVSSLYAGNRDGSRGLQCSHIRSTLDGRTSVDAHAQLDAPSSVHNQTIMHFNALSYANNNSPARVNEAQLSIKCWPTKHRKATITGYFNNQIMAFPWGSMTSGSPNKSTWETFDIVELGNNTVALKSYHGKYLTAHPGGAIYGNASKINAWEKFELIDRGGNSFALRSAHGGYVIALSDGQIRSDSPNLAAWETFRINFLDPR